MDTPKFDLHEFVTGLKTKRIEEARLADLDEYTRKGSGHCKWAETGRGYLVVECPACHEKTATRIEYGDRAGEMEINCDQCDALIEIKLEWVIQPELVNVEYTEKKPEPEASN